MTDDASRGQQPAPRDQRQPDTSIDASPSDTRMLFLGADSLADGFRMIGFETYPNPSPDDVDELFRALRKSRDRAFVIVDEDVMRSGAANLARVRAEGGRIVVVSIPPLAGPVRLESGVAERLAAMFGSVNPAGSG